MNAKTRDALVCPIVGIMLLHRLEASWGANIQDGIGTQSENHGEKRNLSREDAYTACSLAADSRVTQTVNGSKGIHCMIAKTIVYG